MTALHTSRRHSSLRTSASDVSSRHAGVINHSGVRSCAWLQFPPSVYASHAHSERAAGCEGCEVCPCPCEWVSHEVLPVPKSTLVIVGTVRAAKRDARWSSRSSADIARLRMSESSIDSAPRTRIELCSGCAEISKNAMS